MEKGKWIFVVGFSLFLLDLCQKMRFLVFFSHFFRGACSQNILPLQHYKSQEVMDYSLIKVNAEVENLAQDKCQQILHDRREALANKVRRRA